MTTSTRSTLLRALALTGVLAVAFAAPSCSDSDEVPQPPRPIGGGAGGDAGSGGSPGICNATPDCPQGQTCVDGVCKGSAGCKNDLDCPAGKSCDPQTKECVGGAGGDGGGGAGGDGGGGSGGAPPPCVDKYDCALGQVCLGGGKCGTQPSTCQRAPDCGNGYICTSGTCVIGCEENIDCAHDAANSRCNIGSGVCEACRLSIDCPPGRTCAGGTCSAAPQCTTADSCPATEGCVGGSCTACTADNECRTGEKCNTVAGGCYTPQGCSNEQCQQNGPTWFCDPIKNNCFNGCAANTDCSNGQTCDTSTHQCVGGGAACDGVLCPPGQTCNPGTGQCAGDCCAQLTCGADEGCEVSQQGTCACVQDTCCAGINCPSQGKICQIGGGSCACVDGGGGGSCTGADLQNCQTTCSLQGQACDPNTCGCSGGGGGTCGMCVDLCCAVAGGTLDASCSCSGDQAGFFICALLSCGMP